MGVRVAWVLLPLLAGVVSCGSPTPAVTKRSVEDIQFGNQQNLPIGLLDDNALPGAFPSSETSEEAVEVKEGQKKEETKQETQEKKEEAQKAEGKGEGPQQQKGEDVEEEERERREGGEDGEGGGGIMEERRWHQTAIPSLRYYRPHWGVPRLYTSPAFSLRRRRRSLRLPPPLLPRRTKKGNQRSLAGLRSLMRARGEEDPSRQKREVDLDELLKEVDVVDLITMLSHPPPPPPQHHHPHFYPNAPGFGTVRYVPAPARYAPQPKLFPDYEEGEGGPDGVPVGGMGLLKQNVRAAQRLPEVVMPAGGGRRVWRRSGGGGGGGGGSGYGLSALPGFKRSAFRSNNPPPPSQFQHLNPGDVYSLAAMLGAELDPVTHRLRRAAM